MLKLAKYLICLLFFYNFNGFTQNVDEKLDSLYLVEKSGKLSQKEKVDNLNQISFAARGYYPDVNKSYAIKAIAEAKKIDYPKGLVDAYQQMASYYYYESEYDSSIFFNEEALELALKHDLKEFIARSYNNISVDYDELGELDKAITYSMKALKIYEEIGDIDGMASCYLECGNVYYQQGMFQESINHYKEAYKLDKNVGYESGMAYDLGNIGTVFQKMGELDSAIIYLRKCATMREDLQEFHSLGITYVNLANMYRLKEKLDSVKYFMNKGLEVCTITEDRNSLCHLYTSLAFLEMDSYNNLPKAEMYGLKALELAREIKNLYREIKSLEILSGIYEHKKDFKNALKYQKLLTIRQDSLVNTENTKVISDLKLKHEDEKHRLEIENLEQQKLVADQLHESELAQEQLKSSSRQRVIYFLIFGLVIVGGLGFIAFRNFQAKKKANMEIILQKEIVEEKNQEIMDSITYAKRIQSAILPPEKVVKSYLDDSFILYLPKDIVAGDFYWMETVGSSKYQVDNSQSKLGTDYLEPATILIAAADCTGHGVPGAMVSVVCNNGLNRSVREFGLKDPAQILDKTREIVIQEFEKSEEEVKDGMDIALVSLEQQQEGGDTLAQNSCSKLKYSGAHNPLWILRKGSKEIEEIKANKQPIGKFRNAVPFTTHEIKLNSGDQFFIFSDGYADQFGGEKGKKMKTSNFKELLLTLADLPSDKQKDALKKAFLDWKGEMEQLDDVCVIGVRV
ncbi:MAG: tetratricopeptide repeat protein [Crocinitomicaceae bacterium]|nr:tetratricopeptide repeat protein [Crocinitomicaceae bacterium]